MPLEDQPMNAVRMIAVKFSRSRHIRCNDMHFLSAKATEIVVEGNGGTAFRREEEFRDH